MLGAVGCLEMEKSWESYQGKAAQYVRIRPSQRMGAKNKCFFHPPPPHLVYAKYGKEINAEAAARMSGLDSGYPDFKLNRHVFPTAFSCAHVIKLFSEAVHSRRCSSPQAPLPRWMYACDCIPNREKFPLDSSDARRKRLQ